MTYSNLTSYVSRSILKKKNYLKDDIRMTLLNP